jgi:hypothetical protein
MSASVLESIIEPRRGTFSEELARYILSLDFTPEQHAKADQLSEKARLGSLSETERADLDELIYVNAMLGILQSKARVSLKNHSSAA